MKRKAIRKNINKKHNEFAKFVYNKLTNHELDDQLLPYINHLSIT